MSIDDFNYLIKKKFKKELLQSLIDSLNKKNKDASFYYSDVLKRRMCKN